MHCKKDHFLYYSGYSRKSKWVINGLLINATSSRGRPNGAGNQLVYGKLYNFVKDLSRKLIFKKNLTFKGRQELNLIIYTTDLPQIAFSNHFAIIDLQRE